MNLLGSLGVGQAEDPGIIPPGTYGAVVYGSEYVLHRAKGSGEDAPKDHISHVVTYKINDGGSHNGFEKNEWFGLVRVLEFAEDGVTPATDAEGKPKIVPVMTEKQKPWYKKRLVDLGVPENEIDTTFKPEDLVGRNVTLGIKHKDGYVNISFVERRDTPPTATDSASSILGSL